MRLMLTVDKVKKHNYVSIPVILKQEATITISILT